MPGEAAERVFAWEFNRSVHTVERGDPPRTGLLTMSGGWCYRTFVVGALVEVQGGLGEVRWARIADPTGAFDVIPRQPEVPPASTLLTIVPPAFVALTGVARTGGRKGKEKVYIEPEMVVTVDRSARDHWVLFTAERTITRLEALSKVLKGGSERGCAARAVSTYSLATMDLNRMRCMVEEALATVLTTPSSATLSEGDPREAVLAIIASYPPPVAISDILETTAKQGYNEGLVRQCLQTLLEQGECYSPRNGYIKQL